MRTLDPEKLPEYIQRELEEAAREERHALIALVGARIGAVALLAGGIFLIISAFH